MNNSADILRGNSADILSFASGVGGSDFGVAHTSRRSYRDFVASSNEVIHGY